MPAPEKWRDPEAIAAEMKLSLPRVPQGDGELAAQPFPHPFVMIFPNVRNDFRITMRAEVVPLPNKFSAAFDVVEQFPVKNHENAAIFVCHRLLPIGEVDNAQAS